MARISAGAAIGAGFGLIRRRPLEVLAWGAAPALLQGALLLLATPYYVVEFSRLQGGLIGVSPEPHVSPLILPLDALLFLIAPVIYCAIFRALLHPEQSAFAYMRIGASELLTLVLLVAMTVAFFVVTFVAIFVAAFAAGIVVSVAHASPSGLAFGVPIALASLAVLIAMLLACLRFSFVGPMIVDDGRFHLFDSWSTTHGKLGPLLLIGLGLVGIGILVEVIVYALLAAIAGAILASLGGYEHVLAVATASPAALTPMIAPFLAVYLLLFIPLHGCFYAILGAPWAKAYGDLKHGGLEETFA
jgi:hypothetical protein